jgi:hypothetical protein
VREPELEDELGLEPARQLAQPRADGRDRPSARRPLRQRRGHRADRGRALAHDDLFLGREVAEHGRARYVGRLRDPVEGRVGEAVLLEQAHGGVADGVPRRTLLAFPEPSHDNDNSNTQSENKLS